MIQASQSTRRHQRVRTRLRILYGVGVPEFEATADSISLGGAFINTNNVLKVGSRVVIQIEFPERTVRHRGEVTWAIRVPEHQRETMICGMGIVFIDADESWTTFFENWREASER